MRGGRAAPAGWGGEVVERVERLRRMGMAWEVRRRGRRVGGRRKRELMDKGAIA